MTKVIVVGHGGYGTAFKRNITMLMGEPEGFFFVDFNEDDDIGSLRQKLNDTLKLVGDADVLFACDLIGGSPFNETASLSVEHNNYAVVTGLNTSAYTEMTFNLELSARELAILASDIAKQSIMIFPPVEE